jgi:cytochrome c oxidase cbb3-type subunit 3
MAGAAKVASAAPVVALNFYRLQRYRTPGSFFLESTLMRRIIAILALSLSASVLSAAPVSADTGPNAVQAALPDPNNAAAIAAGQIRFNRNCIYCHGNAGSGGKGAPLQGRNDLTPEYLFTTIANGKKRGALVMPPWRDAFTDEEISELGVYILSLSTINAKK